MEKILTISIAAYNMEKYIRRAMDSLIDERIIEDLEIFVLDDGGRDATLEIAEEYAARYPSSVFPVHKENGGYGTTVNYSVEHAKGKYFKLLDGDDWMDRDGLYALVNQLKTIDCDVILTNYFTGPDENHLEKYRIEGLENQKTIDIRELNLKETVWSPGITYRTAMLQSVGLSLPEHMLYTDSIYVLEPLAFANTLCFYNIEVYCYYIGREGQSISKEVRRRHLSEQWKVIEILCKSYENLKQDKRNFFYLHNSITSLYASSFKDFLLTARLSIAAVNDFKSYDKRIQEISSDIYYSAEKNSNTGHVLKWMRRSNFLLFYPAKILLDLFIKFR